MMKNERNTNTENENHEKVVKEIMEKLSKISPQMNGSSKQLEQKMAEFQRITKSLPEEQRKQAAEIWKKFELFAKDGVDGIKRGIPFFQQMMINLQKKQ